jgi:hypothetical protein
VEHLDLVSQEVLEHIEDHLSMLENQVAAVAEPVKLATQD